MKFRNFTNEELINYSNNTVLEFCDAVSLLKVITERFSNSIDERGVLCDELEQLENINSNLSDKIYDLQYELDTL